MRYSAPVRRQFFQLKNGSTVKAAACPGSDMSAPIGYLEAKDCACLSVQEGGADSLAAIALSYAAGALVAPICMPCAGANFSEESLRCLQGKRARIFIDGDEVGSEAANRWARQLQRAYVEVDGFSFAGLLQADGSPVKDLNDLLRCREAHREAILEATNFIQGAL